ncbi:hypothetical protein [Sorangium sp. So ce1099]|uniref:hypothetical protein n=1 Tax=Sorangium sp. So ce1099 TaxID=3133331 RepID=UPI003F62F9A8
MSPPGLVRNRRHARVDLPGMHDPRDLTALVYAALADPVEVLELPHQATPSVLLKLVYDDAGLLVASLHWGTWRRAVEVGEA